MLGLQAPRLQAPALHPAIAADLGCQLHIFQRCQVSDQIIKLEHKANIISAVVCQLLLSVRGNFFSIQQDLSLRQRIHSAKDIQDRCLASAAGSDDHAEFAFFDFEIDALQCGISTSPM